MEYQANFGIDSRVDLKSLDYTEREETISASNNVEALDRAVELAGRYSKSYLGNPDTNNIKVTILTLYDSKKRLLNQREILKKEGFTGVKKFKWDKDRLSINCSLLELILVG